MRQEHGRTWVNWFVRENVDLVWPAKLSDVVIEGFCPI